MTLSPQRNRFQTETSFRDKLTRIYKTPEKFLSRKKSGMENEVVHRDFPKSQNNVPQQFLTSNSSQNPALDVSSVRLFLFSSCTLFSMSAAFTLVA